jgi:hypothetical protein
VGYLRIEPSSVIDKQLGDNHEDSYKKQQLMSPASPTMSPCLPSDPDISGIGVRVAIYAQNLLSFVPAIWALWDGEVSEQELESAEAQSTTILLTAFAILISAMVEVRTVGLSNFHAAVVLNLSWMNNTNTFIYFLLYVQHKTPDQDNKRAAERDVERGVEANERRVLEPDNVEVEPELLKWIAHIKTRTVKAIQNLVFKARGIYVFLGIKGCLSP